MTELVQTNAYNADGLVVVRGEEIWVTFNPPWWSIFRWIAWWLLKNPTRFLLLRLGDQKDRVRVRAYRLAKTHIRLGY